MSALELFRTVAKLTEKPKEFRIWYGKQIVIAGVRAKNRSRRTGNKKIGPQDAPDIVQEALALVRLAALQEKAACASPSTTGLISLDEASEQLIPYIDRAVKGLHKQTRPTRSKFAHELPWQHPYEPMEATQLEDFAAQERIERAEIEAKKLLHGTRYKSDNGTGLYITRLGYIASRAMSTRDISMMFNNNSDATVHQYRTRTAKLVGILDPKDFSDPNIKKNPKA